MSNVIFKTFHINISGASGNNNALDAKQCEGRTGVGRGGGVENRSERGLKRERGEWREGGGVRTL